MLEILALPASAQEGGEEVTVVGGVGPTGMWSNTALVQEADREMKEVTMQEVLDHYWACRQEN